MRCTTCLLYTSDMIDQVAKVVIPASLLNENTKYYINPTGR